MIYGVDTSFLVQIEVVEQPGHAQAHQLKNRILSDKITLGLVPQVLSEFIHVVTDPRRFERPLTAEQAVERSRIWWNLAEVRGLEVNGEAVSRFHDWMIQHRLGRKRILDTMLAATFDVHGISHVITSDQSGFSGFGVFTVVDPLDC